MREFNEKLGTFSLFCIHLFRTKMQFFCKTKNAKFFEKNSQFFVKFLRFFRETELSENSENFRFFLQTECQKKTILSAKRKIFAKRFRLFAGNPNGYCSKIFETKTIIFQFFLQVNRFIFEL